MFDTHRSSEDSPLFHHTRNGATNFYREIEQKLSAYGAQNVLIFGLPLPGRDMSKMVLHQKWGQDPLTSVQLSQIRGNDSLLRRIGASARPIRWSTDPSDSEWLINSPLYNLLRRHANEPAGLGTLIGIHVLLDQMQIIVLASGPHLVVSDVDLCNLLTTISHDMSNLHQAKPVLPTRPGELSMREKMVLCMTAEGKTAGDIASELEISQRTVHAHLQNASEKMQAANKTQTVVEALRYGQIKLD